MNNFILVWSLPLQSNEWLCFNKYCYKMKDIFICNFILCNQVFESQKLLDYHNETIHESNEEITLLDDEFNFDEEEKNSKIEDVLKTENLTLKSKKNHSVFFTVQKPIEGVKTKSKGRQILKETTTKKTIYTKWSKLKKSKSIFNVKQLKELHIKVEKVLQEDDLENCKKLISEGRDAELYLNIFGNFIVSTKRIWKCQPTEDCDGYFLGTLKDYQIHFNDANHGSKVYYNCEFCLFKSKNLHQIIYHMKHLHFQDINCGNCDEKLCSKTELEEHLRKVHKLNSHCDVCQKNCKSVLKLNKHKKTCTVNKIYLVLSVTKHSSTKII